jgi:secondary thiamine-phosphate synthase enzyme
MADAVRSAEPALVQRLASLSVETRGCGFTDISHRLERWLGEVGAVDGLLTLFIRHTSASLVIQENADPDVLSDLADSLDRLAPESRSYRHCNEGPDDMPAHVKSALTATSLAIPVMRGRLATGTWQGVYVAEHRSRPHTRSLALHYLGSTQS